METVLLAFIYFILVVDGGCYSADNILVVRQVCFAALAPVNAAGVEIDVVCESHLVCPFILAPLICGCDLLYSWLATLRVSVDMSKS